MQSSSQTNIFSLLTWSHATIGMGLLLWHAIGNGIPMEWQLIYFTAMIAMTGIPHGALDHVLAKATADREKVDFNLPRFIIKYLFAISAYAVCWIFFPSFSLLAFLVISAWHFGETDIAEAGNHFTWTITRFVWGSFVLLLILLTHQAESIAVIMRITKDSQTTKTVWDLLAVSHTSILYGLFLLSISMLLLAMWKQKISVPLQQVVNLGVVLLLCIQLPLLPSFALYFGGWHAIRSFDIIVRYLNVDHKKERIAPLQVWKKAVPMTVVAGIFFALIAYAWNRLGLKSDPLPLLFIFLSVITLPHLDVMDKVIKDL